MTAPQTAGARLCLRQCREVQEHCGAQCAVQQRACTERMQAQAIQDYERYAREQLLVQEPLDLRPRDFERPALCDPASCRNSCAGKYRDCYRECGGKIEGGV